MDINNIISIIIVAGVFAYIIHKKKKKALKSDANTNANADISTSYVTGRCSSLNRNIHGITFYTVPFDESMETDDYADFDLMLETNLERVINALNADNKKILSISHITGKDRIIFCILY